MRLCRILSGRGHGVREGRVEKDKALKRIMSEGSHSNYVVAQFTKGNWFLFWHIFPLTHT